jgi:hypothetical protein
VLQVQFQDPKVPKDAKVLKVHRGVEVLKVLKDLLDLKVPKEFKVP